MGFNEFVKTDEPGCLYLDEGFALWEIDGGKWDGKPLLLEKTHSILFIVSGELQTKIDGKAYVFSRNGFADIIDAIPLEVVSLSEDLHAYHMLLTENFLGSVIKNRPPFPFSYMLDMKEHPVAAVNDDAMAVYVHRAEEIAALLRDTDHRFRTEMVRNAVFMFLLDVADTYINIKHCESEESSDESGRMKMLFARFMYLLPQHVCENHTVGFYASKLCITPQYLNRIVRRISGGSASETINRMLVGEIVKLLNDTDLSIQEIADRLHFSDQATLTKFFGRHKGMSPTEYRKSNR